MPEEVAQILGIAMVDGLGALGLLAGSEAINTFETAAGCLQILLSKGAHTCFLRMLNPPPGQVRLPRPDTVLQTVLHVFYIPHLQRHSSAGMHHHSVHSCECVHRPAASCSASGICLYGE